MIFIVLEIKTENSKVLINYNIHDKYNNYKPITCQQNNIFKLKITKFLKANNLVLQVALFYIFANSFNVWLNTKQLYSHNCLYIQSVAINGLVEVYEDNSASHRNDVEKGGLFSFFR